MHGMETAGKNEIYGRKRFRAASGAGEQRGITIGEKRGEKRSTINSIRNLMKNMHWSAEEAMAAIGIEQSQYKQYLALL